MCPPKRRAELENFEHVGGRHSLTDPNRNENTAYADAFAAALLMPETAVRRFCAAHEHSGISVILCADQFRVPVEVAYHRLHGLGLLPEQAAA